MLGATTRDLFLLQQDAVFLNHGSFGAVPKPVREAQQRWRDIVETQPDVFFRETIYTATRASAERIGAFAGAPGDSLVFLPNVTETVAVVLDAMRFKRGDEIVLLDVAYSAVRRAVDVTCQRTGAVLRVVPTALQMTPEGYAEGLRAALNPNTRLVLLDHIVSPTAQLVPIETLVPIAKAAGARVFIDGAHALGQLPLNIAALGADWYTTNAHKWLFTPRGCCILYTAPEMQELTRPVIVSHYYMDGYPRCFDYVGTRDVTAYLSAADGADFVESLGFDAITAHRTALIAHADAALSQMGATLVTPHAPGLAAWALPMTRPADAIDARAFMGMYWNDYRIQFASNAVDGRLLLRLSLQIYNDTADIDLLIEKLQRLGWAGQIEGT
ncbi:Isopenicillin N epimerase [Alphaproteobacteria bacterium SO-S41]|nr:Isopenicillin N epimerase [Alphaproteobacteria bacterium SO-S41]